MSDTSPSYLRGFIVPYNNLGTANLWSAQSSYTQAENTAGDPVPQQSSRLIVRGAGSQSASSDLQIITQRAGHVRNGAAFTWKNNNLVSTDVGALSPYYIKVKIRDIDGNLTAKTVYNFPTSYTPTNDSHPNLLLMPDGDVLCLFLVEDTDLKVMQLHVYRSLDNGSTWNRLSRSALGATISVHPSTGYTIKRLRSAVIGGQILLYSMIHLLSIGIDYINLPL